MPKRQSPSHSAPPAPEFVPPYSPSWLNRLIDWIERQPGPAWIYYVAGVLVMAFVLALGDLVTGSVPRMTSGTGAMIYALYPVYFVALMHYLDGQASLALQRFRPALSVSDGDYARLEYQLTTVPASGAWLATALAVPLGIDFSLGTETAPFSLARLPLLVLAVAFTVFTVACFAILAFHTIRQLRQVSELHREATMINLLQPQPAYAFSRLTSRVAIGVIVFFYFDFLVNPPTPGVALPYFTFTGIALLLIVAAFVLPLLGMHQRLAEEKARLAEGVNQEMEIVYRQLQEQVRSNAYGRVDQLEKSLSGVLRMREVIARLSTWPWQPETLRGLLAAVGLPIVIWLVQFGLQRLLG